MSAKRTRREQSWVPEAIAEGRDGRLHTIADELERETDRGCLIIGAEILNAELEALLRSVLTLDPRSVKKVVDPLFLNYAPLSSFDARIQIAFALRLIPHEIKLTLDLLRKLRNEFAHEPGPLTFTDPACKDRLRTLLSSGELPLGMDESDLTRIEPGRPKLRRALAFKIIFIAGRISYYREAVTRGDHPAITVKRTIPSTAAKSASRPEDQ